MEQNFEQDIPISWLIAGFIVLMIVSTAIQRISRRRMLRRQGQIDLDGGRVPTVDERLAGNPAWSTGEIYSRGIKTVIALWIPAVAINLLFGIGFYKVITNPELPTASRVVMGVFFLLALVFAAFTIRFTMQHRRFGQSCCRIQGKAGILGKVMQGSVRTASEVHAKGDYTFELQCMESYSVGSGKNRRTEIKTLWQAKHKVPPLGQSSTAGIPFSFTLPPWSPASPPETGDQLSRGDINWQLLVHAPVEGVDYSAVFNVPVFRME